MADFFKDITFELTAAILIYLAGVLTSRFWHLLRKSSEEKKLKANAQIALEIIYEAEESFPGRKRGAEKLVYAVEKFMTKAGVKDYQTAQNYIIQIFNLTNLSKIDLPPSNTF